MDIKPQKTASTASIDKLAELMDKLEEEIYTRMYRKDEVEVEDVKAAFLETVTDTEFIRGLLR